jgi:hypothetical protein
MAEIHHPDGRIELDEADLRTIADSPLYNPDLAPVPMAQRNWTTYNFAALWISMAHCIPTYMLASGLIESGMSWWQALFTILAGNCIVLVAHPAQQPSRNPLRRSLPGAAARKLRQLWCQPAGADASAGRLRLVWHQRLDRRRRPKHVLYRLLPGWPTALGVLPSAAIYRRSGSASCCFGA